MSFQAVKAVLDATVKLSLGELAIWFVLAWHHHQQTGLCNPGERLIASETQMDRRSVRKVLKRLILDGGISITQPKRGTLTPHYQLHLEWLASGRPRRPQTTAASGRPGRPQSPATEAASGRRQDSLVGALVHASGRPRRPNRYRKKILKRSTYPAAATGLHRVTTALALDTGADAFAMFWDRYPRKTAKADALKAFHKIGPDDRLLATMLAALDWQTQSPSWLKHDGQYVPYPATWLRGRRWEDARPHGGYADKTEAAWAELEAHLATRKGGPR